MRFDHHFGFMRRLARDVRGNTIAIMAAALIPLCGVVGGGIDVGRMYITKTRLQHACDAGALAGRKAMGGGTWTQTVNSVANYPNAAAVRFFDANFESGAFGSGTRTRAYTENAGKVSGTATVDLPMTLMKVFAIPNQTLTVTCSSEMRLPNTDVMFVLDTTGSMGETPTGDTQTKMASLKVSVKCFYEIVAKLDTDADCTTGTPSGGTGSQTQIRFGFVPYSTNVNVGRLLKPEWFADSWKYQSREAEYMSYPPYTATPGPSSPPTTGSWSSYTYDSETAHTSTSQTCTAPANNSSQSTTNTDSAVTESGGVRTYTTTTVVTTTSRRYRTTSERTGFGSNRTYWCEYTVSSKNDTTTTSTVYTSQGTPTMTPSATTSFYRWHYGQIATNISALKNGTSWNASFVMPLGASATSKTITWDGCIEERHTVRQDSYDPIPGGADDLDLDTVPTSSDADSLWAPALPGVIYTRRDSSGNWTMDPQYTTTDFGNSSTYVCPAQAKKLQAWASATAFSTYVDSLSPSGNTYHDIGLIWGGRLMSPTGLFAAENSLTAGGGEIQRNIIFMTDGDPCTTSKNYQAYGVAWYDRRQTDQNTAPTQNQTCTSGAPLVDQVNARTTAICTAIKNKNVTLWVITFGSVDPNTVTRLTACASPGRYFAASNAATLQSTFASIANQISQLRLTQ